jgi:hypothetical protein
MSRGEFQRVVSEIPRPTRASDPPERRQHLAFPPPFSVAGLRVDDQGLLWLALHVAARDWDKIELTYRENTSEVALTEDVILRRYETVIDVIDPLRSQLLTRSRIAGFGELTPDGSLAMPSYDSLGVIKVELMQLGLRRSS